MAYHGLEGIELFPKQDHITDGPGSLIRMPFGVHWRTGRRYAFYAPGGVPLAPSVRGQIDALGAAEPVPEQLPIREWPVSAAEVMGPGRFEYNDLLGEEILARIEALRKQERFKYNLENVAAQGARSYGFRHLGRCTGRTSESERILAAILGRASESKLASDQAAAMATIGMIGLPAIALMNQPNRVWR